MVYLSVGCGELCLQIRLSVCWLEVMFAIGFVCLLVGAYVWYWVCLFVGWWLCDNIISFNSRDGVSVGLFFITDLNQSHGFYLFIYFFYVAFCCYVYYHGLFVSCLGWCGCWAFFLFCFVISICTELLCFGRGI